MAHRVRDPEIIIFWLNARLPLDPESTGRVSWSFTNLRLRTAIKSHLVLQQLGMTSRGGAELAKSDLRIAQFMERLDKHTRSNRSHIYDMIVTLTNRRDNSILDIEPNLRQMVKEVKGKLVEVKCDRVGKKVDNRAVFEAIQAKCSDLSCVGPSGTGSKIGHSVAQRLKSCTNVFTNKAEQRLAQRSALEITFGAFHEHTLEWYHKYATDRTLKSKFFHVRHAVTIFKDCRFHPGQTVQLLKGVLKPVLGC